MSIEQAHEVLDRAKCGFGIPEIAITQALIDTGDLRIERLKGFPKPARELLPILRGQGGAEVQALARIAGIGVEEAYEGLSFLEGQGLAKFWIPNRGGKYLLAQWYATDKK